MNQSPLYLLRTKAPAPFTQSIALVSDSFVDIKMGILATDKNNKKNKPAGEKQKSHRNNKMSP